MTDDLISRAAALLPCPFCGGKAETITGPKPRKWGTQCTNCDVWRDDRCKSEAEAIAAWNTRALPAVAASQTADPDVKADSQQAVRVKPLVWEEVFHTIFEATGFNCKYQIRLGSDLITRWQSAYMSEWLVAASVNAAKAAAQADYEQCILAAIETQPDPRDEVIAGLVEALAFYADKSTYETQYERMPCDCCTDIFEPINDDKGYKARTALAAAKQLNSEVLK